MSDRNPLLAQDELQRAAWEYGKVGLLIDDSREAAVRVARALYGGETLPEWWSLVRSVACACEALSTFQEIFADRQFTNLRGFVFIDRYLPARCGDLRAVPWDDESYRIEEGFEGREHLLRMREIVEELRKGHDREVRDLREEEPDYTVRFFTSFPTLAGRASGGNPSIRWQKRGLVMLQEERRDFLKWRSWRRLLRYGPESDARIIRHEVPDLLSPERTLRARWRAETWRQNLWALSQMLDEMPVVLMTGAGCSLATNPVSPGMPPTDKILARVCDEMEREKAAEAEAWPPRSPRPCACALPSAPATKDLIWTDIETDGFPVDWFRSNAKKHGIGRLDWRLEILFSRALHLVGGEERFRTFHRRFRDLLYRTDYDFAYHHWLLAQFPWSSLITTNFDGFHERAASAVARLQDLKPQQRFTSLRLGTLSRAEDRTKVPKARGALFKPYGSLYSPDGEIVLGHEDIKEFRVQFDKAFRKAVQHARDLRGGASAGALVVIGHSMRDDSINGVWRRLWKRIGLEKLQILWIDPASYDCCSKDRKGLSFWESQIRARMEKRLRGPHHVPGGAKDLFTQECSGPVPAKAHEFIYDLWALYTLDPKQRESWF